MKCVHVLYAHLFLALGTQVVLEVKMAKGNNLAVLLEVTVEFSKVENGMCASHSRECLQLFSFSFYHVPSILYSTNVYLICGIQHSS